jgi:hypothetical protein
MNKIENSLAFMLLQFAVSAGCGVCDDADFPVSTTGLNTDLEAQAGGVSALAFYKRGATTLVDPELPADWAAAVTAGDLRVINGCYGQGGIEDASTVEQLGACEVPVKSKSETVLTFDYIEDNITRDVHAFMKNLENKTNCYQVAMVFCNGDVTAFLDASVIAAYAADNTKSGKRRWTLTVTFQEVPDYLTVNFAAIWAAISGLPQ